MTLRLAAAQFAVQADPSHNADTIRAQIAEAAGAGAKLVAFPETALPGYTPWEHPHLDAFDWSALEEATASVAAAAREHAIWVFAGTIAPSGDPARPRNRVTVFDPGGAEHATYDKRLLARSELPHFTPGTEPCLVEVEGYRVGVAICHEWRYPEIYRGYAALGADLIVQCWYDGAYDETSWEREGRELADVIPTTARGHAVCNHLWFLGSNTARPRSCFGPFLVRPDGTFAARGERERDEVLVATITPREDFADASGHHRPRLIADGRV